MPEGDGDTQESTLVGDVHIAGVPEPVAFGQAARVAPPSSEFLLQVLDLVAHPVFAKGRDNRYVVVNRATGDAMGRSPAEILGRTDADLFPALEAARRRKDDQEALSSGVALELPEQWLTTPSGELRVMATTKIPLFDSGGQATHVVGVAHDITHLKDLEGSLERSKKEFEAKAERRAVALERAQRGLLQKERSAALGQLAAGLAHQLLNSLGAILNASSVMARQGTPERELGMALQALRREVQESSATLQDLLSHTQVRAPRLLPASVATVLSDALNSLCVPENVTVHTQVDPEIEALVDAQQLVTALSHLIRNAVEAMPSGGELHLSAREFGEIVSIRVRDTGVGIDARAEPYIFDPLVSSKALGLGLGLSTCRLLIDAQDGGVSYLGSDPGAAFEVVVPSNVSMPSGCKRRIG